jgi:hypothetical protein
MGRTMSGSYQLIYEEVGQMPPDTTASRRIALSVQRESTTAITLVDDAGNTLDDAFVVEDGSCELSLEALASAKEVLVAINVTLPAREFRELLDTEATLDVGALLARPASDALASARSPHRPSSTHGTHKKP